MSKYCLVKAGVPTDRVQESKDTPPDISHKGMSWAPYTRTPDPSYNARTHKLGWSQKVLASGVVTESRSLIALTQQEIDDQDNGEVTAALESVKELALALNDGSFVPGSNYTNAQMRAIIKAHR